MSKSGWSKVLLWFVLPLLIGSAYCAFKGIDLSVTSEEGLNYSLPGMKSDARYLAAEISHADASFREA